MNLALQTHINLACIHKSKTVIGHSQTIYTAHPSLLPQIQNPVERNNLTSVNSALLGSMFRSNPRTRVYVCYEYNCNCN